MNTHGVHVCVCARCEPGSSGSSRETSVSLNLDEPGQPAPETAERGVWLNTVCTVQHGRDVVEESWGQCRQTLDGLIDNKRAPISCFLKLLLLLLLLCDHAEGFFFKARRRRAVFES